MILYDEIEKERKSRKLTLITIAFVLIIWGAVNWFFSSVLLFVYSSWFSLVLISHTRPNIFEHLNNAERLGNYQKSHENTLKLIKENNPFYLYLHSFATNEEFSVEKKHYVPERSNQIVYMPDGQPKLIPFKQPATTVITSEYKSPIKDIVKHAKKMA